MKKGSFFYNYTALKTGVYNKFSYGIISVECDEDRELSSEAFEAIKKESNKQFPDADNINFTAFNPV
ncbi:hypothetical protein MAELSTROM_67 [Pseudoalteromonas phage Maelstrom]|uniref:hypothetical protein n=1 Tax=Pseudoalteromonas phage Maelstrom TaxID=2065202 RepID=UPI000CA0D93A|nr:hypothetical protein PP584_gp67 [Pseudoalteromonas phage Maelstrom]AUG84986.1 hypothetical protein MAELSTROM_67 [Pseudoalteromonas phage Maelstrom]